MTSENRRNNLRKRKVEDIRGDSTKLNSKRIIIRKNEDDIMKKKIKQEAKLEIGNLKEMKIIHHNKLKNKEVEIKEKFEANVNNFSSIEVFDNTGKCDISLYVNKDISDDEKIYTLKNIWIPDESFAFSLDDSYLYKFKYEWLQQYEWLAYSKIKNGAFCKYCVLFVSDVLNDNCLRTFCTKQCSNWKYYKRVFERHNIRSYHIECIELAKRLLLKNNFETTIIKLDNIDIINVKENEPILNSVRNDNNRNYEKETKLDDVNENETIIQNKLREMKNIKERKSDENAQYYSNKKSFEDINNYSKQHDISLYVNKKFSNEEKVKALRNIWFPVENYNFSIRDSSSYFFKYKWFQRYEWLAYSEIENGAFCKYCVLFVSDVLNDQFLRTFCTKKCSNMRNCEYYLDLHSKRFYHIECVKLAEELLSCIKTSFIKLNNEHNITMENEYLQESINNIKEDDRHFENDENDLQLGIENVKESIPPMQYILRTKEKITQRTAYKNSKSFNNVNYHSEKLDISFYVNKDISDSDKMKVLRNIWVPDESFDFSKNDSSFFQFKYEWLQNYEWLAYSQIEYGAYCKYCVLFVSTVLNCQFLRTFCTKKCFNWRYSSILEKHQNRGYHIECVKLAEKLLNIGNAPILKADNIDSINRYEDEYLQVKFTVDNVKEFNIESKLESKFNDVSTVSNEESIVYRKLCLAIAKRISKSLNNQGKDNEQQSSNKFENYQHNENLDISTLKSIQNYLNMQSKNQQQLKNSNEEDSQKLPDQVKLIKDEIRYDLDTINKENERNTKKIIKIDVKILKAAQELFTVLFTDVQPFQNLLVNIGFENEENSTVTIE